MKANNYKVLCSILCICTVLIVRQAKAQDTTTQTNPVKRISYVNEDFPRLKWDISTDLQFLLRENYGQGDILVRYNKTKRKKNWGLQYTAIRYRLQLHHSKANNEDLGKYITKEELDQNGYNRYHTRYTNLQSTYIGVALGYEWQQYYGRFMIHYGADLKLGRSVGEWEFAEYFTSNNSRYPGDEFDIYKTTALSSSKSTRVALAPVFGMRYFIHPMISITAETQLSVGYEHTSSKSDDSYSYNFYNNIPLNTTIGTTFINHTPISLLGVTFHIGK